MASDLVLLDLRLSAEALRKVHRLLNGVIVKIPEYEREKLKSLISETNLETVAQRLEFLHDSLTQK